MDCPHCGTENLIGASVCAACGKTMLSRPRFLTPSGVVAPTERDVVQSPSIRSTADEMAAPPAAWGAVAAPVAEAVAAAPSEPIHVLCRVCQEPFDRPPDAQGLPLCPSCRTFSREVTQMAPNEVQMHPAAAPDAAPTEGLALRMAAAAPRPKPILVKRTGLRTGPVVLVAALVLTAIGAAVYAVAGREPDRANELLGSVKSEATTVVLIPEDGFVARHETKIRIDAQREEARAFGGAVKSLELKQTTLQSSEGAFVRVDEKGAIFDVTSEGRVLEQSGTVGPEDAREMSLHPWQGPRPPMRIRADAAASPAQLDGAGALAGADLPPLFHVGALHAPSAEFRTGDRWKTTLELPALVDRQGRLLTWHFPAEIAYAGKAVRNGYACAAFRVTAQIPRDLPPVLDDVYNRSSGKIAGAVWIELTTGVVAGAELEVSARVWKDAGRVEDDLRLTGRITVERK